MNIGLILILFLLSWLGLEILILILTNKKFAFEIYKVKKDKNAVESEKERINKESRLYGTRALTLGGLIFAAISLLIGSFNDANIIKNTLLILVFGFSLCLISYKIEVLTDKRIFWTIQEKCLNFGFLTLIFALSVYFFEQSLIEIFYLIIIFIIIGGLIHIYEFLIDVKYYLEMKEDKNMKKEEKIFKNPEMNKAMFISLLVAIILLAIEAIRYAITLIIDMIIYGASFDKAVGSYSYAFGLLVAILILGYFIRLFYKDIKK